MCGLAEHARYGVYPLLRCACAPSAPRQGRCDDCCLASMGIYVFTAAFLIDELRRSAEGPTRPTTLGSTSCPRIIGRESVRAFSFSGRGDGPQRYWRDVGTVDAYFQANMDLLGDTPGLDLYDKAWPIYSSSRVPAAPRGGRARAGRAGVRRRSATISSRTGRWPRGGFGGRVVGFDCRIERDAIVEDSILFDGASVGRGAEVRRAILDEGVQVRPGARIGVDPDAGSEPGVRGERRRRHLCPGRHRRGSAGEGRTGTIAFVIDLCSACVSQPTWAWFRSKFTQEGR